MKSKNYKGPERRAYLRLDAGFTVGYIKPSYVKKIKLTMLCSGTGI